MLHNFESPDYGAFSASNGSLKINKSSAVTLPSNANNGNTVYAVNKVFEQVTDNYGGDERVTLRKYNFKGKYAVNMRIAFPHTNSSSWIDFMGVKMDTNNIPSAASVGRLTNIGSAGKLNVYNNKLNTSASAIPMWTGTKNAADISVVFNSEDSTFQIFKDDSQTPSKTTATVNSGASADTFAMTSWNKCGNGSYISGIRFAANKDMTPQDFIKLESLSISEIEAMPMPALDSTVEALTMSKITSSPDSVTENLTLPSSLEDGVSITWASDNTAVIGSDGVIHYAADDTDVTMTAKITNTADKFTVYKDFRITVKKTMPIKLSLANSDSGLSTDITNITSETINIKMLAAAYNEDETLDKVLLSDIPAAEGSVNVPIKGLSADKTIRVFVWDENMIPLAKSECLPK